MLISTISKAQQKIKEKATRIKEPEGGRSAVKCWVFSVVCFDMSTTILNSANVTACTRPALSDYVSPNPSMALTEKLLTVNMGRGVVVENHL